jgi:hypothetical protein
MNVILKNITRSLDIRILTWINRPQPAHSSGVAPIPVSWVGSIVAFDDSGLSGCSVFKRSSDGLVSVSMLLLLLIMLLFLMLLGGVIVSFLTLSVK